MKFTCEVKINQTLERVVDLWSNPDNLKFWQEGFERIEQISGQPGAINSKAKLYFKNGKRKMVLLETILKNDLPSEFIGLYEHKHMVNTMSNRFSAIDEHNTIYTAEIEYTKFIGLMPKLMAKLFPGMFKKQVQKWLNRFKTFAESNR